MSRYAPLSDLVRQREEGSQWTLSLERSVLDPES